MYGVFVYRRKVVTMNTSGFLVFIFAALFRFTGHGAKTWVGYLVQDTRLLAPQFPLKPSRLLARSPYSKPASSQN